MKKITDKIIDVFLEDEMKKNYLSYALSVITERALPDIRDGLKPVHRRILYTMYKINNIYNKPFIKCARIVGEVMGKYHPHGDSSIYEALVRMVQKFSLRYTLIQGQGNFGSIDGDNTAAMRYTECRLKKISNEILKDIEKNTVDFILNYDGKEKEPVVLPTKIPNLLINGSSGIAVGLATNIPPHNAIEIIDGILYLIKNKKCSIEELIKIIPAPDFPTGGIIYGVKEVHNAYKTGKGKMIIRAKTHIETYNKKNEAIIIDEIPYQVNKKNLLEKILKLIQEKKIEGINNLRDESDKSGIRIVIELKNNELSNIILEKLYKYTQLQETFGINIIALVNKQPKLLNLKQVLKHFIIHRKEIITRKTKFKIKKAKKKEHLLEGLAIAVDNIKKFIKIITSSKNPKNATILLLKKKWFSKTIIKINKNNFSYNLTDIQTKKILQIKLQKLTTFERNNIISKYKNIKKTIKYLKKILSSKILLKKIICEELEEIKNIFIKNKDKRLSKIEKNISQITKKNLIISENIIITLSYNGFINSHSILEYKKQKKINKKEILILKKNDWIIKLLIINTNDYIFCFTNMGKLYYTKVIKIKQNFKSLEENQIINIFNIKKNEKINTILKVSKEEMKSSENKYIFMSTKLGIVKKTPLSEFKKIRKNGLIAINLKKNDYLIGAVLTNNQYDIMLFTNSGKVTRFKENNIKITNRNSKGIIGMKLKNDEKITTLLVYKNKKQYIFTISKNGYAKKTSIKEYICEKKGTKGTLNIKIDQKNDKIISTILVKKKDKIILITKKGIIIKINISEIPKISKLTQKTKLITIEKNDKINSLQKI